MSHHITPSLDSIVIKAKYRVPEKNFDEIFKILEVGLHGAWLIHDRLGDSAQFVIADVPKWPNDLTKKRPGIPASFALVVIERLADGFILEVECKPVMYYLITQVKKREFSEQEIEETLIECSRFVRDIMGGLLKAREVEPPSVYPAIRRTEVKSRLMNLGLREIVDTLDSAERHILQNNFVDSLGRSRTAFEKMVSRQLSKRSIGETGSCSNNLERLRGKGFLDQDTAELLKSYYHYLSNVGVHERGVKPGLFEAQMGYGLTLIALDYFMNRLE